MVKNTPANAGDAGSIPAWGRAPGAGVATHASILAWRIPWIEEPGGLHCPWGCKEWDTTERLNKNKRLKKVTHRNKDAIIVA